MSMQKNKGNGWERDVCKYFGELFGGNWTRTLGSGNFLGGKNAFRRQFVSKNQSQMMFGDISAPDEYNVIIECKAYKDISFNKIIDGNCAQLNTWIQQNEDDLKTKGDNSFQMIVFKINGRGKYVCLPIDESFTSNLKSYMLYNYNNKSYILINMDNLKTIKEHLINKFKK